MGDELIINLGTIAKPGARAFLVAMAAGGDISRIGQFSVGFYSARLVLDKARAVGKYDDDKQYSVKRGLEVICYLKEDQPVFLEERLLKDLVKKGSEFFRFPIEEHKPCCLYVKAATCSGNVAWHQGCAGASARQTLNVF